jgi:penicillin-binding protein 1A
MINGALVALDVGTGAVLASAGGYDFRNSPFDRVMQAKRQPGSGIKPFIYAQAIDAGLATPATMITDAPKAFFDPGTEEFWRPRNHNRRFLGDITFRHCLRSSINTCTITLLERVGLDTFLNFAKEVELVTKSTPYPRNLTIALGSGENYPISVANAMRIFPNRGIYSPHYLIDKFSTSDGKTESLFEFKPVRVIKEESAFIITNILRSVIHGTNHSKYLSNVKAQVAGKTGTNNDVRSAWFIGFSPEVLALVYVGYDDNRSIGADEWGITTAFPIWANFMNSIDINREELAFSVPEGIEWHWMDKNTGVVYEHVDVEEEDEDEDEHDSSLVMEAFIKGTLSSLASSETIIKAQPKLQEEAAFAP